MKFAAGILVAALASVAHALVAFTNAGYDVKAGQAFTLSWSGGVGPVTINLKNGPPTNLVTVETLTTTGAGTGSFTFTLPATLTTDTYAFEIVDGTQTNYSPQFQFVGAAPTSSAALTTSAPATTSAVTTSTSASTTSSSSSSSSSSRSTTGSSTTTSASPTATRPSNTNSAPRYGSPLALVLVTVAALIYFN